MKSANISQTRNNLSSLLRAVRRGARISIRERNRTIAWLIPARPDSGEGLEELEAAGMVRRAMCPLDDEFLAASKPPQVRSDVEAALLRNREEDR